MSGKRRRNFRCDVCRRKVLHLSEVSMIGAGGVLLAVGHRWCVDLVQEELVASGAELGERREVRTEEEFRLALSELFGHAEA